MSGRRTCVGLALWVVSCSLLQPRFVAIDPEYGFVDGCTDVVLQGAKLGVDASATIGGEAIASLTPAEYRPELGDHAQDVGFKYFGVTPPAAEAGYQDVVMTVDEEPLTLFKGFYYVDCPDTFYVDTDLIASVAQAGETLAVSGCGLDPDDIEGRIYDATGTQVLETFALTLTCSTAKAEFVVPDLPPGDYWVELEDSSGTRYGGPCLTAADTGSASDDTGTADTDDSNSDTDSAGSDSDTDGRDSDADTSGDSAGDSAFDTADPCSGTVSLTVVEGGAP